MIEGDRLTLQVTDPYYGQFLVDKNDVILRHKEIVYDHLRVHTTEEDVVSIALLFMTQASLGRLAMMGIPEAYLDIPTRSTVDVYAMDSINRMEKDFDEAN